MAQEKRPTQRMSASSICLGLVALLGFLGALWFQRSRWPLSIAASRYVEMRIRLASSDAKTTERTIVILFRGSECGAVLEQLAGASSSKNGAVTSIRGLVLSDVSIGKVRELLNNQRISIPLDPIDSEIALAFLAHRRLRTLPVAFEVVGDSLRRVSLREFSVTHP